MMAIMERSYRTSNNASLDIPIYSNYMIDARFHKAATKEFKNRKFFCGVTSGFPIVYGKSNIEEDILCCYEAMCKDKERNYCVISTVRIANLIDKDTLQRKKFEGNFPNYGTMPITVTTNIGKFNSCKIPRIGVHLECKDSYYIVLYGYSANDKLYFMLLRPENLNQDFIKVINNEIEEQIANNLITLFNESFFSFIE